MLKLNKKIKYKKKFFINIFIDNVGSQSRTWHNKFYNSKIAAISQFPKLVKHLNEMLGSNSKENDYFFRVEEWTQTQVGKPSETYQNINGTLKLKKK